MQSIKRARSPVTVQEWVAALPDTEPVTDNIVANNADHEDDTDNEETPDTDDAEIDLVLGAEAGYNCSHNIQQNTQG